jgi:hypothetical protein
MPSLLSYSQTFSGPIFGVTAIDHTSNVSASQMASIEHAADRYVFNSNENLWINIQHDPDEARAQLVALRHHIPRPSAARYSG